MTQTPFKSYAELILASASPRRRELLHGLGLDFHIEAAAVDERLKPRENPQDFVQRIASEKAETIGANFPDTWVLGADTIVVLDDTILGKPADAEDAMRMLCFLSGRSHEVMTGFTLCNRQAGQDFRKMVRTEVLFTAFTEEIAAAYVRTGEPLDKAGSYGIQGMGGVLVQEIKGSYSNVVGLPLAEVVEALLGFGVIGPRSG